MAKLASSHEHADRLYHRRHVVVTEKAGVTT